MTITWQILGAKSVFFCHMKADYYQQVKVIKLKCFSSLSLSSSPPCSVTSSGGILQQPMRALFPLLPADEPEIIEHEGCPLL